METEATVASPILGGVIANTSESPIPTLGSIPPGPISIRSVPSSTVNTKVSATLVRSVVVTARLTGSA